MKKLSILFFTLFLTAGLVAQDMSNERLGEIITRVADTVAGDTGGWQFLVEDRILLCITDSGNNRMRIITPIADVADLSQEEIRNSLIANFHTALDVKYAISDEKMWAIFVHPLRELSAEQVESAIIQVYNASVTFGTIYSSTTLSFPGNTQPDSGTAEPKQPKLQKG